VVSFHLSERERQASWSMATRRMRPPRRLKTNASVTPGSGLSDQVERPLRTRPNQRGALGTGPDALGNLLSPSHHTDAL